MDKFLGRTYDVQTATWRHPDGSGGALPEEIRLDAMAALTGDPIGSFLRFFIPIWRWKYSRANPQTE